MRYLTLILPVALVCYSACDDRSPTRHAESEAVAAPNSATTAGARSVAAPATTAPSDSPKPGPSAVSMARPVTSSKEMSPAEMFHAYCTACHSLEMVETQHLDRKTWEWVMNDVVNKYGGTWITEKEQKILIDYLVAHYGPES